MLLNSFAHIYGLKKKTASKTKIQNILSSLSLSDVKRHLGEGSISRDVGILKLHSSKGTYWVVYLNESFFHSYGCAPPQKLSKCIIKQNGHCLYSECKTQCLTSKKDSYCEAYYLYIIHLTKVIGIDFKSAVLNLYYQRFLYIIDVMENYI